jgi:hypothetical protein
MVMRTVEMDFEYMNYIPKPPTKKEQLYQQACANDGITIKSWHDIWVSNMKANHKKYGPFKNRSVGKLWGKYARQPGICIGSGPSLKWNIKEHVDTKGIVKVSCLHNYHYLEDNGAKADYYVSLDAGEITIDEISKGGKKTHDEYVKSTKDKTLLAYVGSSPKLLDAWKGEILFFTCPVPNEKVLTEMKAIENFNTFVSSGGNVLGACVYIAKAFLGCNPIVFTGADFSFDYKKKFHSWQDARYDELGNCMRGIDVFGNKVLTWRSYFNFKCFFDWMCSTLPGIYYNCTEGGTLGAYPEGNIDDIRQMPLSMFKRMYSMHEDMKDQCLKPDQTSNRILY